MAGKNESVSIFLKSVYFRRFETFKGQKKKTRAGERAARYKWVVRGKEAVGMGVLATVSLHVCH